MSIRILHRASSAALPLLLVAMLLAAAGPAAAGGDTPVAVPDTYSVGEDGTLTVDAGTGVLDNDTDTENDPLTAALVDDVTDGTLTLNADGSFTYVPDLNFNGDDTFTYTASDDASTSAPALVTITVTAVNDRPLANQDRYCLTEVGGSVVLPVLDNDSDVDLDTLDVTITTAPDPGLGTAVVNGDDTITFTPAAGATVYDYFIYEASDGALSDPARVYIDLHAGSPDPMACADTVSTPEDTPKLIDVGANDTDTAPPATLAIDTQPTNGVAAIQGGSIQYTPNQDFVGTDTFTYSLSDGTTDTAPVTVNVTAVNDVPVANGDTATATGRAPVTIPVLSNDTDPDGDPLTVGTINPPTTGTAVPSTDQQQIVFTAEDCGDVQSFTYRADDGTAMSELAPVDVTVNVGTPIVSLTRSPAAPTILGYGGTVTLTAHLDVHAYAPGAMLKLWRTPASGGDPILVTEAAPDADGDVVAAVQLFEKNTFFAEWGGDGCYAPDASANKTVLVRAKITGKVFSCLDPSRPSGGCYYGTLGIYKLFRITAPKDPLYLSTVTPSKAGLPLLKWVIQRKVAGKWKPYFTFDNLQLDPNSMFGAGMPVNEVGVFRVHGVFKGDSINVTKTSAWTYFKITT